MNQAMSMQPDEPLVLLTAPTGLAAFNIGGITQHSGFMLNCNNNISESSDWEKKTTIQLKLKNIVLLVIDEISMVALATFKRVSACGFEEN